MKKLLFSIAAIALSINSAQAQVEINATNFPDENFRAQVKEAFDTIVEDDIISAEEMEANGGHHNFDRVSNLKGIELLTSITELQIINYPDEPGITTFDYELPNLLWLIIQDQVGVLTTVDATKCTNLEYFGAIENPAGLSTLKLPSSLKELNLNYAPLIKTFDPKELPNLITLTLSGNTGISDLDFSGHESIQNIGVDGVHDYYELNSLNMANCPQLTNIDIKNCTIKSLTFKSLPEMLSILVYDSDITNMLVDDLAQLGSIEAHDNVLGTLTLNNLPAITGLDCKDNKLHTLIVDDCPQMNGINAENNRLMWLDLQDVKDSGVEMNTLKLDNQHPSVDAYKLSPTEVGILVHERFDASRVKNLEAGGVPVPNPTFAEYDGVKYFVVSIDGENPENLQGYKTWYEYDTKWPYNWMEGNSSNNRLQVNLNVDKIYKLDSWLKLSSTETLKAKVGETLTPPTYTHSDGYDTEDVELKWMSSDETVVKVDANTGELTIVGPGTATITLSGNETKYRNAPTNVSYNVEITMPFVAGDANGDGAVDAADIVEVVNYIMNNPTSKFVIDGADANHDGTVNAADIVMIVNTILSVN